jgi:hypothetical protein
MIERISVAARASLKYSVSIFATYALSAAIGATMAHKGSSFALTQRDQIVGRAIAHDRSSIDYRAGRRSRAALRDAAANFTLAALPQTLTGLAVIIPYFTVARQGWVGGIVSVDGSHRSRLRTVRGAAYYLGVLILQFLAFSVCIGAGIKLGVEVYVQNRAVGWRLWEYRVSRPVLSDFLLVAATSIPLFLIASAYEFLSPWNR